MTVSTLRPDGTDISSGVTVTGAASAHAALNDDSDSSYVSINGSAALDVTLDDLTLPADAIVKKLALRLRLDRQSAGSSGYGVGFVGLSDGAFQITWTTPTTVTAWTYQDASLTDSVVDALVATVNGGNDPGTIDVYELYVDATYVEQPTLTVDAPTSTVTDTNLPTIEWTPTLDSDGGAQTRWDVKVFDSATYGGGGFDPDTSTPVAEVFAASGDATSWAMGDTPTLLNGGYVDNDILPDGDYRAYVRVAQTVNSEGHYSDWAFSAFTVSVALPAVPTLTVTADDANARVEVQVQSNSGSATTDRFQIEVSRDGGTSWASMRVTSADLVDPTDGDETVWDYDGANGVTSTYRARAQHDYSGAYASSAWVEDTGAWTSTDWWLKHPTLPALNRAVAVRSQPERTRRARNGVFQAIGRSRAIVVDDTRAAPEGPIVLRTDTEQQEEDLDALLDALVSLHLQAPLAARWDRWVRFGTVTTRRTVDTSTSDVREHTLEWVHVEASTDAIEEWPA